MWRNVLKVALATTAFAAVHSALASKQAKDLAEDMFGKKNRNTWYRPFYLAQSVVTFGMLGLYTRRLPDRTLWIARGPLRVACLTGQSAGIIFAVITAHQVSIPEMLGASGLAARLDGFKVLPEPEAQGPALGSNGEMKATGPFRWSRHPLNLAPLPVFWLWPHMTVRLLTFNLIGTLYLYAGSFHEESRLRAAYGAAYKTYQKVGVSFYLPRPPVSPDEDGMSRDAGRE